MGNALHENAPASGQVYYEIRQIFVHNTSIFFFSKKIILSSFQLPFNILAFTMPYITDRKQFLREIELAMLIADDDDDYEAAEVLLELYALTSFSRFTQDRIRRH